MAKGDARVAQLAGDRDAGEAGDAPATAVAEAHRLLALGCEVVEDGSVYQVGTYNGNPLGMAAARANLAEEAAADRDLGARVEGVDLAGPVDDATFAAIASSMVRRLTTLSASAIWGRGRRSRSAGSTGSAASTEISAPPPSGFPWASTTL
mgnify:CR=1 FL=1